MACDKCIYEDTIKELKRQQELYDKKNSERHAEFYERLNMLDKYTSRAETQYENTMEKLDNIEIKLNQIMDKPNKRWESIIGALIGALVGGIVGMMLK